MHAQVLLEFSQLMSKVSISNCKPTHEGICH